MSILEKVKKGENIFVVSQEKINAYVKQGYKAISSNESNVISDEIKYSFIIPEDYINYFLLTESLKNVAELSIKDKKLMFFALNLPFITGIKRKVNIMINNTKVTNLQYLSDYVKKMVRIISFNKPFKRTYENDLKLVNNAYEYFMKHIPANGDVIAYNKAVVDTYKLFPTDRSILNIFVIIQGYISKNPIFLNNINNATAFLEKNNKVIYDMFKDFITDISKETENITLLPFDMGGEEYGY